MLLNGQVGLPFPASGVPWNMSLSNLSMAAEAWVVLRWVGVAAPAQLYVRAPYVGAPYLGTLCFGALCFGALCFGALCFARRCGSRGPGRWRGARGWSIRCPPLVMSPAP